MYASYLTMARQPKDAIRSFEKAAKILDNFPETHPLRYTFEPQMCAPLSKLYLEAKDYGKSATFLKRVLQYSPNPIFLYNMSQQLEIVKNKIQNPDEKIVEPPKIPK